MKNNLSATTESFTKLVKSYLEDALIEYHLTRMNFGETGTIIVLPWK